MIDGLKLTMTGEQLIAKLNERIEDYEESARDHRRMLEEVQTEEEQRVRHYALETEVTRNERRIEALTLIRDHIVLDEVYRLGEYDLKFADLLPDEEWLDCGCLGKWRGHDDEETMEDLRPLENASPQADQPTPESRQPVGGHTPSSPVSASSSDMARSRSSASAPGMRR